jgi:hypothetical protein
VFFGADGEMVKAQSIRLKVRLIQGKQTTNVVSEKEF